MSIRVAAYIAEGMTSGVLARSGHLRDALETDDIIALDRATWRPWGATGDQEAGVVRIAVDDILVAVADDDPTIPVHASWHPISLEAGPYRIEGELPTLPGYDPGRALTRPTGEFVMLRDVRLGFIEGEGVMSPVGHHALINRYGVDRVQADIMLGFYFPGAALEGVESDEPPTAPTAAPPTTAAAT